MGVTKCIGTVVEKVATGRAEAEAAVKAAAGKAEIGGIMHFLDCFPDKNKNFYPTSGIE